MSLVFAMGAVALGVAAVLLGGYDDSPGLQLIGVLLVVTAIVLVVRHTRANRKGCGRPLP